MGGYLRRQLRTALDRWKYGQRERERGRSLFIQISLVLVAKKRKLLGTALDRWKYGQRECERVGT